MANFSPSNLVAAQTRLAAKFTAPETREKVLPALKLGLSNSDILIGGVNELRTREDRAVYGYMMKRQVRVPGSQRSATHTNPSGDSQQIPFSWITYTDGFSISLKQMDNNIFSWNEAFDKDMLNCILNIHSQIETDYVTFLLTNKNQVVKTTTPIGTRVFWNAAPNFTHEIAAADQKQFFQLAKEVMVQNYYNNGTFDVIASGQTYVNASFWAAQGVENAQNTSFQFTGMNIAQSVDLSDANYGQGIALVMPPGSAALIDWIPKQNRMGHGDYNSTLGGYGSFKDPYGTNLTFAVHGYTLRSDTSTLNGVQQDDLLQIEISVDVAQAVSPYSNANESPVFEFGQM